jgi:type I restriction enzyme M protein
MVKDLEKTLLGTDDKLCNNMDAAESKHIVLCLIFLKYISDSFKELHSKLSNYKLKNFKLKSVITFF